MERIFTTAEGIELYFDEDTYTYKTDDIDAVKAALEKDIHNYQIDPSSAIVAHNLLTIMEDMDRMANYKQL
jgi:hypothetical protein